MTTLDRQLHRDATLASGRPAPHIAPRQRPAHRIQSDAEAIEVARGLAERFAIGAAARDRDRTLPLAEIEQFSASGLWAITVPREYGGAAVSSATLAEVTAIIAAADGSIGQIPQNHFYMVEALSLAATEEQKRHYLGRVLEGARLGNAFTEIGTRTPVEFRTRLTRDGARFSLTGQKFYSTGALFADIVAVVALDEAERSTIVLLERATPGLTLVDDWSSFGQRTTGSGSTYIDAVAVEAFQVVPHQDVFDRPTQMGPVAQIIHAAVEVGIARGALAETIAFVRQHTRPFFETSYAHGYEDPHIIHAVGDIATRVEAANALLARAGDLVDRAAAIPDERSVAEASIAVAEIKAWATDTALFAASKLFELAGARSTLESFGLDRYWRNARTHTLHDPVRWKYHHVGNFYLNEILPPRHGAL